MAEYKVQIGQPMSPDEWRQIRDRLARAFPYCGAYLRSLNGDGRGAEDEEAFMLDCAMALVAVEYVADCASDKVRFVPIPKKGKGGGT